MRVKRKQDGTSNVRVFGLRPEMFFAYQVAYFIYVELDNEKNCVITSARDGKHKRSSDHYMGCAIDLRIWGFTPQTAQKATAMLKERLSDEFEVFLEKDHIHIGFDIQYL